MIWQKYWEGLDVRNPSLEKQYGFSETRLWRLILTWGGGIVFPPVYRAVL
jgi:hypothetical protein